MHLRLLGPPELWANGRAASLGGSKQRALLALLALRAGEVVRRDRLIEALWGESPPEGAAHRLDVHVSRLRAAMRAAGADPSLLETAEGGYRLLLDGWALDVSEAERLVQQGRRALAEGRSREAEETLRAALDLWRGPPLADLSDDPGSRGDARRLEELRVAALEDRIDAELELGRHSELVPELQRLVSEHPLRERLRGQLMLALYRSDRQAEALEAYGDARRALLGELGIEPSESLRKLERAILAHDPSLTDQRAAGIPSAPPTAPSHEPPVAGAAERRPWALVAALILLGTLAIAGVVWLLAAGSSDRGGAAPLTDDSHAVALIDPSDNTVSKVASVGARPGPLAYDRDSGSLWVANLEDRTVTHLESKRLRVGRTIPVGDVPGGLAAGGGALWVSSGNRTDAFVTIRKISARFDTRERTLRVASSPSGTADVALSGRSLWVAPSFGLLTRVDPRTGAVRRPAIDTGHAPTAVAAGPDAVWVADRSANAVTRVDRASGLATSIPVGNGPTGLAADGRDVWVALGLDDELVRIDAASGSVRETIPVGRAPAGVAVGAGAVWVANSGDGTLSRVDPGTDEVVATVRVGASPQDIAVSGERVWASVRPRTLREPPGSGGTARLESLAEVDSMDPALGFTQLSFQLGYATGAKLLNYPDLPGQAGSRLEPEVADSLPTLSSDGTTYTFRVRRGFRFSPPSNEPVTARTFKYTIERSLDPRLHGPAATYLQGLLRDVVGARRYVAGRARHVSGITARGSTLRIRLTHPAADFLYRVSLPFFAAVPVGTPIDRDGLRRVPSAGPYYVASYVPDEGVVLRRNPNYRGARPHRLREIRLRFGVGHDRAIAHVEAGSADYAADAITPENAASLERRYGAGSRASRSRGQQYFVNRSQTVDYLALNMSRKPFSSGDLRRAVNYAIDRRALARVGGINNSLPATPSDHYLPVGLPGYRDARLYPLRPNLKKARRLAGPARRTAVLYAPDRPPSPQLAEIVRTNLRAIGVELEVKLFPDPVVFDKAGRPGEPFDIVMFPWVPDYPDPGNVLGLLDARSNKAAPNLNFARFDDPAYNGRLTAAARLSGPRRYIAFGRLDLDLVRGAAPWVAFANETAHDFFSARIGCQVYKPLYGMDLAALCIRP